jgi:predicted acylesterase/phospholipase RssA
MLVDELDTMVVIAGGGFRQVECGLGAMKALYEAGVTPTRYRGSSAGAIVSALMAANYSPHHIIDELKKRPTDTLISRNWGYLWWLKFVPPVYDYTGLESFVSELLGERTFTNATVTMTNKEKRRTEYVAASADTAMASLSIPVVFPSRIIYGTEYVDGGVYDNIPTPHRSHAGLYKKIYIIVSNKDDNAGRHYSTRIGKCLKWMDESSEREYRQIMDDWSDLDNVTIIRPTPYKSSLLGWSKDYGLVDHAYNETKKILESE